MSSYNEMSWTDPCGLDSKLIWNGASARSNEKCHTKWTDVNFTVETKKEADGGVTIAGTGISEFEGVQFGFTLSGYVTQEGRFAVVTKTHDVPDTPVLTYRLLLSRKTVTNVCRIVGIGRVEPAPLDGLMKQIEREEAGDMTDSDSRLASVRQQRPVFHLAAVSVVYALVTIGIIFSMQPWDVRHKFHVASTVGYLAVLSYFYFGLNAYVSKLDAALDEALKAHAAALRQRDAIDKSRTNFLAFITHELRNPLHAILATTSSMKEHEAKEFDKAEQLNTISAAADMMLVVCNDILDISRVDAGKFELQNAAFSLKEVIGKVTRTHRAAVQTKRIYFTSSYTVPIDQVTGDPIRLCQVLSNVLSNAIKYTPEKGKVSLDVVPCPSMNDHDAHGVEFRISDTGVGMTSHTQSLLFQPFVRGKEPVSSKAPNGTGLGLVISQRSVELMNGKIKVASTIGVGTQVSIQIPFREPTTAQSQAIHLGPQASTTSSSSSSSSFALSATQRRVLVVEDDHIIQRIMCRMFKELGMKCDSVSNGQEGVDSVTKDLNRYDAVFMDCIMPVMDGYEATEKMRAAGYRKPIIAVTATTFSEDRIKCLNSGMDEVVCKPFTKSELQRIMRRFLHFAISPE